MKSADTLCEDSFPNLSRAADTLGQLQQAERERRRSATLDRATNTFTAAERDFVGQYASKKTRRWTNKRGSSVW
jgi:hypothetical protein